MIALKIYQIRGSSNLLVEKRNQKGAVRRSLFLSLSYNVLPYNRVSVEKIIW